MQLGTSAHSTPKRCDTQELLMGGLTAIFIINTFLQAPKVFSTLLSLKLNVYSVSLYQAPLKF